jgi:hypothetical protein
MADRDIDVADGILVRLPLTAVQKQFRRPLRNAIASALAARAERAKRDENEACAKVMDAIVCGLCGMDGKAGDTIRARMQKETT